MDYTILLQIIATVIIFLAVLLYIVWQIKKKGLKKTVVNLIVIAEELFEDGEGQEKMNYVIDSVIGLLPFPLRLVITRNTLRKFIQKIFDIIKQALDYIPEENLIIEDGEEG